MWDNVSVGENSYSQVNSSKIALNLSNNGEVQLSNICFLDHFVTPISYSVTFLLVMKLAVSLKKYWRLF